MCRSFGVVKFRRWNASDEVFAVLNVQVVMLRIFVFREKVPAEQFAVEPAGALRIRRAQISPTQSSIHVGNAGALVFVGLPDAKHRASGVLQHGHSARLAYVEGLL